MMRTLLKNIYFLWIIFLPNYGLCFQQGCKYSFQYEGSLASGIPELTTQYAGTGLKLTVEMDMTSDFNAAVQMKNIRSGEYNEQVPEKYLKSPHMNYTENPKLKPLEDPFRVYFRNTSGTVMEVPQEEAQWITNIKKSIFHLMENSLNVGSPSQYSLINNHLTNDGIRQTYFTQMEDSIHGTCEAIYTLTPSDMICTQPGTAEDLNLSNDDSCTIIDESCKMWALKKEINFNNCSDPVFLQLNGIGVSEMIVNNTIADVASRRSHVNYYLQQASPSSHHLLLTSMEGVGGVVTRPHGVKSEPLQLFTFQNISLTSASKSTSNGTNVGSMKTINNWKYTVSSPLANSSKSWDWVNYSQDIGGSLFPETILTGIQMTKQEKVEHLVNIKAFVRDAAKSLLGTPVITKNGLQPFGSEYGKSASALRTTATALRAFNLDDLKDMWIHYDNSTFDQISSMLLQDVMAECGSYPCIKKIIDKAQERAEMSPLRIGTIFLTLATTTLDPQAIEYIVNYIPSLNLFHNRFEASIAFVSVATILRRQCVSSPSMTHAVPLQLYGRDYCKPHLFEKFHSHINTLLRMSHDGWELLILHRALVNLGTSESLEYLLERLDDDSLTTLIKTSIIQGLTPKIFKPHHRVKICNKLAFLWKDVNRPLRIREFSLLTLVKWGHDAAWWKTLALDSLVEPTKEMTSLIWSIIKSEAKTPPSPDAPRNPGAASALLLAKQVDESKSYSYKERYFFNYHERDFYLQNDIDHLRTKWNKVPLDIFATLKGSFSGLDINLLETRLSVETLMEIFMDGLSSLKKKEKHYLKPKTTGLVKDLMKNKFVNETLKSSMIDIKILEDIELFFPFDADLIEHLLHEFYFKKTKTIFAKFVNPLKQESFFVSDVGLPIMKMNYNPNLLYLENTRQADQLDFNITGDLRYSGKSTTVLKALVPYGSGVVATGVDVEKSTAASAKFFNGLYWGYINHSIFPIGDDKMPLLYSHNIPFTLTKPLFPVQKPSDLEDVKTVLRGFNRTSVKYNEHFELNTDDFGLDIYGSWHSDLQPPTKKQDLTHLLLNPAVLPLAIISSPVTEFYRCSVVLDPAMSNVNDINFVYLTYWGWTNHTNGMNDDRKNLTIRDLDYYPKWMKDDMIENSKPLSMKEAVNKYFPDVKTEISNYCMTPHNNLHLRNHILVQLWGINGYNVQYDVGLDGSVVCLDPIRAIDHYFFLFTFYGRFHEYILKIPMYINSPSIGVLDLMPLEVTTTIHSTYSIIVEGKEYSLANMKAYFDLSQKRHDYLVLYPKDYPNLKSIYDYVDIKLKWNQFDLPRLSPKMYAAAHYIDDLVVGTRYPHVTNNYMVEPHRDPNRVHLYATRSTYEEMWSVIKLGTSYTTHFDQIVAPEYWDEKYKLYNLVLEPVIHDNDKCTISGTWVEGFDSERINYNCASGCWVVVMVSCGSMEDFYIMTQQSELDPGKMGALQMVMERHHIELQLERNGKWPKVNGKPIDSLHEVFTDKEGQVIFELDCEEKKECTVKIPQKLKFTVSDKVYVTVEKDYKSKICGLCQDQNTLHSGFLGPDGCIYYDPNLFVTSWTLPAGVNCQRHKLSKYKDLQHHYQQTCPKPIAGDLYL